MQSLPLDEVLFRGAVSLERGDGWVKPWRIPFEDFVLFPPNGIGGHAEIPAGVRLAFVSDTTSVAVAIVALGSPTLLDCVVDGELISTQRIAPGADETIFEGLPPRTKRIEIFLSQNVPVRLAGVAIDDGARAAPAPGGRPRWITYGSSITQCGAAASPSQTWPALVARHHDLDLTCFGFGGNCHLEPMVARMIRDLPADLISLCLGINVQGGSTLGPRTFRPAVIGFVRIVREGHPGVPLAVMSPIISPPRETTKNAVGLSLTDMRQEIREAVEALRSRGDRDVHYVDGLSVMGEEHARHLPDLLHPDGEGYRVMAGNFERAVVGPVFCR